MSLSVYLAGAMEFAGDGGTNWRREMTDWLARELGHSALDPTILEHDQLSDAERVAVPGMKNGRFDELRPLAQRIIRYDLDLVLNKADYLICYWNHDTQMGCGTAGEITLAAWAGKPVYMLLDYPCEKASTWMVGCTTSIHSTWDELKDELKNAYLEKVL